MPVLAAPPPPSDPTMVALAVDLRKQLLLKSTSKTRVKLYTAWLKAHPNY